MPILRQVGHCRVPALLVQSTPIHFRVVVAAIVKSCLGWTGQGTLESKNGDVLSQIEGKKFLPAVSKEALGLSRTSALICCLRRYCVHDYSAVDRFWKVSQSSKGRCRST